MTVEVGALLQSEVSSLPNGGDGGYPNHSSEPDADWRKPLSVSGVTWRRITY
jgi:hypothetical protein